MNGSFLFLGTGASVGIPVIGCQCTVCTSLSPYNHRLRPSGLIRLQGKTFLIDVGPDFRQQALKFKIDHLDGLLLTHTHYDHIAGIDELRIFYVRGGEALPCLLSQESYDDLKRRYYYIFQPIGEMATLSTQLDLHFLPELDGEVEFLGVRIDFCSYFQGHMKVTGYRFGDFAYISDIREYNDSLFKKLAGVRTLVVSALRDEPSKLHFSLTEATTFARKVGAQMTYLIHMNHKLDHEATNQKLPSDVQLAHDGLEIEFGTN